jgi:hypothetical protein
MKSIYYDYHSTTNNGRDWPDICKKHRRPKHLDQEFTIWLSPNRLKNHPRIAKTNKGR